MSNVGEVAEVPSAATRRTVAPLRFEPQGKVTVAVPEPALTVPSEVTPNMMSTFCAVP